MSEQGKKKPILALCGVFSYSAKDRFPFPNYGAVEASNWSGDSSGDIRDGFCGLPWGVGDPRATSLGIYTEWAVIRIDDENGGIPIPATGVEEPSVAAVKFRFGTIFYKGDRRGAIETLIQHGADPDHMSVKLALPGANGIADVSAFGVAVGSMGGMARAAEHGQALAESGYGGIAVAEASGHAQATCEHGIAIVGAHGSAHAGDGGAAIVRGVGGWASAEKGGAALALETARSLHVEGGTAIALRQVGRISGGPHSLVVVGQAVVNQTRVLLGEGALAILRFEQPTGTGSRFAVAHAGPGGIEPNAWHVWTGDQFRKIGDFAARPSLTDEQLRETQDDQPGAEHDIGTSAFSFSLKPGLGDDVIVLCPGKPRGAKGESGQLVEARQWDPDPTSPEGIFGLAWGIGSPDLARKHAWFPDHFEDWMLVHVSNPVVVRVAENLSGELVKFAEGKIVYRGHLRGALELLAASGVDRRKIVGQLKFGDPGSILRVHEFDIAAVGRGGWAIADLRAETGQSGLAMSHSAKAGRRGIAVTSDGVAEAGLKGIAICDDKRYGRTNAGDGGIALGLGSRFAYAEAGEGGAAIVQGIGGTARVGDEGIAVGGLNTRAVAGRNGIAISSRTCPEGSAGCLLVCRSGDEFRTAIVDESGTTPAEFAAWAEAMNKDLWDTAVRSGPSLGD